VFFRGSIHGSPYFPGKRAGKTPIYMAGAGRDNKPFKDVPAEQPYNRPDVYNKPPAVLSLNNHLRDFKKNPTF
jgi:hypothetical protein